MWRSSTARVTRNGLIAYWFFGEICNARAKRQRWSPPKKGGRRANRDDKKETKIGFFWNFSRIVAASSRVDARCKRRPAASLFSSTTMYRRVDAGGPAIEPYSLWLVHVSTFQRKEKKKEGTKKFIALNQDFIIFCVCLLCMLCVVPRSERLHSKSSRFTSRRVQDAAKA